MPKPLPTKRERRAVSQRNARVFAKISQQHYADGDRLALMRAIRLCLAAGIPVPKWAASAFGQAFDRVASKQAASWDEVFGRPWPKGLHLARARRDDRLKWRVWDTFRGRRKDETHSPRKGASSASAARRRGSSTTPPPARFAS